MKIYNKLQHKEGILIGFWILINPFFLYFHKTFGDSKTFEVFGRTIEHGYVSNEVFIWYILVKVVAVLSLLTWFLTTNYRWKYFILAPLMVYMYSLIIAFDFIPILVENNALFAKFLTAVVLGLITLFDYYHFQKRRIIKFRAKDIALNRDIYKVVQSRGAWIRSQEKQLSYKAYFHELFKLKQLMALIFTRTKLKNNTSSNWKNILDILICTILVLMVPMYYTFEMVPEEVQTYTLYGITIGSHGFPDTRIFVWYVCLKLCIIIPLCIWFITCENWWRYAILSPIILFTYQLWSAYRNVTSEIDNYEYVKAIPTILILVAALIYISNKVKYKVRLLDYYENLSNEIEVLMKKINTEKSNIIKDKYGFKAIQRNIVSSSETTTIYLNNLHIMKKELLEQLDQVN